MKKILVVDDDKNICELLRLYIEKEGFLVKIANDGKRAVEIFNFENPDLVILDIMLPVLDGWQVCNEIRKKSNVPIIMLTAKDEVFDKVLGLNLGADDYLPKPFDSKELVARMKAVLRRNESNKEKPLCKKVEFENLSVDLSTYQLRVRDNIVSVPAKEIELLFFLVSHPNLVFSREKLLDEIWGSNYYPDPRTIDVHIRRLREKIKGSSKNWELKTVWGIGYKFEVKAANEK
ncbi:MAG: response regulator transcription factor [Oscillospiraceae bacterium]|nr:response regulator transcription factor [Oscillospiraceae bacterium]